MTLLGNYGALRGFRWLLPCAVCASVAACSGEEGGGDSTTGWALPTTSSSLDGSTTGSTTTGGSATTGGSTTTSGSTTGGSTTSATTTTGGPATTTGLTTGGSTADATSTTNGGTTGTTSDAGPVMTDGGAGEGGVVEPKRVPPCIDNDKDVVMIGDSYIDWVTHSFIADMRAEAGQQWPSYAVGGTAMATGGLGLIPEQLDQALADNPDFKMIVMSGGGNDILVADTGMFPRGNECTTNKEAPTIPDCQAIVEKALDAAQDLMVKAADAGITDTVYFFYPHIPGGPGAPFSISGPNPNEILDYALPFAREVCESALEVTEGKMKCHFVDMVPVFEGQKDVFATVLDGVHPNSAGSKLMAKKIWSVMQDACLGQPSGSGCCMEP